MTRLEIKIQISDGGELLGELTGDEIRSYIRNRWGDSDSGPGGVWRDLLEGLARHLGEARYYVPTDEPTVVVDRVSGKRATCEDRKTAQYVAAALERDRS